MAEEAGGGKRAKRGAERQLTKDDDPDAPAGGGPDEAEPTFDGAFERASEEELKTRKIIKVRRRNAIAPTSGGGAANPFTAALAVRAATEVAAQQPAGGGPAGGGSPAPGSPVRAAPTAAAANPFGGISLAAKPQAAPKPANPFGGLSFGAAAKPAEAPSQPGSGGVAGAAGGFAAFQGKDAKPLSSFGGFGGFSGFGAAAGAGDGAPGGAAGGVAGASGGFGAFGNGGGAGGAAFVFGKPRPADENGEGGSGEASPEPEPAARAVKLDKVETETGEEDEEHLFEGNGSLFVFDANTWRERGKGSLHLNVAKSNQARIVMRAVGNKKLLLNANLYPGMVLTEMDGKKGVTFSCINGIEDAKQEPVTYAIRIKPAAVLEDFMGKVEKHKANAVKEPAAAAATGEAAV